MQSSEPSLYLVGHWNYPEDENAYVYEVKDESFNYTGDTALRDAKYKTIYVIASNVDKVKLIVNGEQKGVCTEPTAGYIYSFENIDITQHGYIEAVSELFFENNGGAVEWLAEHRTVAGMLNGKTAFMQIDNPAVFIDGKNNILSSAPYISDDMRYAGEELFSLIIE